MSQAPSPRDTVPAQGTGGEQPFDANRFPLDPGIRLLEASAGTGKTFALAHLVLRYLTELPLNLRQLLVVTFTDAAAAELRDRIGRRLQQALNGLEDPDRPAPDPVLADWLSQQHPRAATLRARLLLALEDLDAADITTIHGFCRRSLQRQALEAGQPPDLQLDGEAAVLVQQISHDYWQQQVLPLPVTLLAGLQRAGLDPALLATLLQRLESDPALQLDPLPAGLDPTRPLQDQLPHLWRQRWQALQTAWEQHSEALDADLRAAAAHWRSLGCRKTDPYAPTARRDRRGDLTTWLASQPESGDYGAVMARQGAAELLHSYFHPGAFLKVARTVEQSDGSEPSLPQRPLLEAIAAVVDGPAEALLLHAAHWGRRELRERRERRGQVGFAQLLEGLDPGEACSTPLLEAVGERYAVALIDEFQDTDPIQWRILSRTFRPERHRLVMVGDPKQAIYRFRGGELATYLAARAIAAAGGGISALTDNHRSTPGLIKALNALMAPGLRRSGLPVPEVQAKARVEPLQLGGDGSTIELLWLGNTREAGDKLPSRTSLEQQLPGQIASYTADLLQRGQEAELRPGQICLLVGTHNQAERLRGALERCGIGSRLVSKGDVFESAGATALQRFLDALANPASSRRLRLLAASPLLGWSAARIATADGDTWSALAGQLADLAAQLPQRGLLGVFGALVKAQGMARLSLGGRLLADLQQCAELVQERLHSDQLGPAAAADWLRRLRLEPDRQVPDAHQPNSDGIDEAVSVVTVHRSKGLEYPVVICPYLWQAPGGRSPTSGPGVRWQPEGSDAPRLDLHRSSHWGPGYRARTEQLQAELQERERLAYVAATRAQRLLVLVWGAAAGQEGNPLHPWLFSREGLPPPGSDPYTARGDTAWREMMEEEIGLRQLPLRLVDPPPAGMVIPYQPAPGTQPSPLQTGRRPERGFDSTWGRSSYSSWTHGRQSAAPAALEEGRETDGAIREPELVAAMENSAPGQNWPASGPLADFPRGSQAGDCLHRLLEQLDYQRPLEEQGELCLAELRRAGIAGEHLPAVQAGLERLRLLPFNGPLTGLRLADLPAHERLHEMNFDLPLDWVQAKDLAAAFSAADHGVFGKGYAEELAQLPIASRGFLTGSIDLVFRHRERWWVIDWKSNWLGERDGDGRPLHCGPRHYGAASLTALMATNHYPLQAHLYVVALHRYLGWRLPDYSPGKHLGGYVYVFLRGLPDPAEAPGAARDPLQTAQEAQSAQTVSPLPGVFLEQPPLERLLALNRILGTGQPMGDPQP